VSETITHTSIDEETISNIKNFIETLSNPFDVKVNYHFLNFNDTQQPQKLGTYGVIKGARQYIGASIKLEPYSLEALGYEMEVLISIFSSFRSWYLLVRWNF
jgi:hypothetical protein